MPKVKTVESTGKITVTKSEERYPYASEILMRHGFFIIFFNMALGLLPVTIWGTRMKYFKCSISQAYTTVFCLCFIILSVIFVPIIFFPKKNDLTSVTNLVILVSMGMLHTVGYVCLLIRGHFVARKIPIVWGQLSKLVQIAILDVYGNHCYLLNEARSFAKWAVIEYTGIISTTMGSQVVLSLDYSRGIQDSIKYYKLNVYVWPPTRDWTPFELLQYVSYELGYFIWMLCSSCHVLVSMFLCYMVIVITICLKSVNQQINEFKEQVTRIRRPGQGSSSIISQSVSLPRIQFCGRSRSNRGVDYPGNTNVILERLDNIKTVVLIAEEITQSISYIWGISLIVEALILITAGTVNAYNFLVMFQEQGKDSDGSFIKFNIPIVDQWIDVFITVSIHFFFLFKLASQVNKMIDEAHTSLHLLKQISSHHLPQVIRDKVHSLKQDLASTSISITAKNFFQVNKFLITSISSQITTYVIVLLQFKQQDYMNNNPNPTTNTTEMPPQVTTDMSPTVTSDVTSEL